MNYTIEDYAHKNVLDVLTQNMTSALCLNKVDIPYDIITMYTTIKVSSAFGIRQTFQVVPPNEVNLKENKISVISSLGASVIGRAQGDRISYGLPGDTVSLVIEKVKQPKTANKTTTKGDKTEEVNIH